MKKIRITDDDRRRWAAARALIEERIRLADEWLAEYAVRQEARERRRERLRRLTFGLLGR